MQNIKDSYIKNKFVQLVEEKHQEIVEMYMNDVLKNSKTSAYSSLDKQKIYETADNVYREISQWIRKGLFTNDMEEFYQKLGQIRLEQNVPFSQVFYALVLMKRYIWIFVRKNLENDVNNYQQVLELINGVILHFDRAIYNMLIGYEKEIFKKW